ncbi:MAG: fumarylacetoacetase [Bacteroidales bacterium]|nr:fumarylacetoacetase [Bacteroidales bacterium]
MILANDPSLKTWIDVQENSDFPVQNIPFGIISASGRDPVPATRIGNTVIDLSVLADFGYFDLMDLDDLSVFYAPVLNDFIALGKAVTSKVRNRIAELFSTGNNELRENKDALSLALFDIADTQMLMPVHVGDYTDFYSSMEHATNVGIMFRDPENALLPNWKHIPVGYHGRSSSIVVSGTDIRRPMGQTKADDEVNPSFGPSRLLDFELEMAFITSTTTKLGGQIPIDQAEDHIFGMVLFNDLSARDIQKWEYVPLGPFLGKSFGSVVSPWIVTLDALEPFRVEGPIQDPPVLPYLRFEGKKSFDISLEVLIKPDNGDENTVCRSNFRFMYWNMAQQLAHQTINGCNINPGDMYGSGTISGPEPGTFGSMLELAWKGTKPLKLSDGSERKFIHDHDTIIMRGYAKNENVRIGFGEVVTKILPAIDHK